MKHSQITKRFIKGTTFCAALLMLIACSSEDPAISQINHFIEQKQFNTQQENWRTQLTQPPLLTFSEEKRYFWDLTTNIGPLTIELFHKTAPYHVSSTIYLTQLGFYDNLTFHRVIPGFMAQGGDPLGNGRGNPGYKYAGEFSAQHSHNKAGIVSMANSGPNTDGSQFFITFTATPFLDNRHTIFGQVTEGLDDTLKKIEPLGQRNGKTQTTINITVAKIRVEDAFLE